MAMNELLEEQKVAVADLNRIVRNFKADPKQRKAELKYYEKKLQQLEEWWVKFDGNNTKLQQFADSGEQYFDDDTFDDVREIYIKHRTKLQDDQNALQQKLDKKEEEKNMQSTSAKGASTSFASVDLDELKQMQDEQSGSDDGSDLDDFQRNLNIIDEMEENNLRNSSDPAEVKVSV